MDQSRADTCDDKIGPCDDNCDQTCKATYGPETQSKCDGPVGNSSCTCHYQCIKVCNGGTGMCSEACPNNCCDMNCAKKYIGGHGYCNSLGNFRLCQCNYPC